MTNLVYLSGPMRVEEVRNVPGVGQLMEVTIFDDEDNRKRYPAYLTDKQAKTVIKNNHKDAQDLPVVIIKGSLFILEDRLMVLGKYIDFITSD